MAGQNNRDRVLLNRGGLSIICPLHILKNFGCDAGANVVKGFNGSRGIDALATGLHGDILVLVKIQTGLRRLEQVLDAIIVEAAAARPATGHAAEGAATIAAVTTTARRRAVSALGAIAPAEAA
jgi:hypothetical protein